MYVVLPQTDTPHKQPSKLPPSRQVMQEQGMILLLCKIALHTLLQLGHASQQAWPAQHGSTAAAGLWPLSEKGWLCTGSCRREDTHT